MGRIVRFVFAVVVALGASFASAQSAAVAAELREMAGHAGVIFSGQVVAIDRNDAAGFVDIRFRIEECVRACSRTGTYTLREWAGLWSADAARYRVGQRRLMLLTARGRSGMSSPVGGMDGAIPLVATGTEPLADKAGVAPPDTAAAASLAVDLRWIQARVVRSSEAARENAHVVGFGGPAMPIAPSPDGWEPIAALNPSPASTPAAMPALMSILALLQSSTGASDARF